MHSRNIHIAEIRNCFYKIMKYRSRMTLNISNLNIKSHQSAMEFWMINEWFWYEKWAVKLPVSGHWRIIIYHFLDEFDIGKTFLWLDIIDIPYQRNILQIHYHQTPYLQLCYLLYWNNNLLIYWIVHRPYHLNECFSWLFKSDSYHKGWKRKNVYCNCSHFFKCFDLLNILPTTVAELLLNTWSENSQFFVVKSDVR